MENNSNQYYGQYSSSNSKQSSSNSFSPIVDSFHYKSIKPLNNKAYIDRVVAELAEKIKPSHKLYDFVGKNSAIIGAHAEAVVSNFIKEFVAPLNISTGAIINPANPFPIKKEHKLIVPQLDCIIWAPNPFPPVFHIENFGLVPLHSVFGIVEVKAFPYEKNKKKLSIVKILDKKDSLIPDFLTEESIKCVIPVIRKKDKMINEFEDLVSQEKVLILSAEVANEEGQLEIVPETKPILAFVKYLNKIKECYYNPDNKRHFDLNI